MPDISKVNGVEVGNISKVDNVETGSVNTMLSGSFPAQQADPAQTSLTNIDFESGRAFGPSAANATHLEVASAVATALCILESDALKYTHSPLSKFSPAVNVAVIPDTFPSPGVLSRWASKAKFIDDENVVAELNVNPASSA